MKTILVPVDASATATAVCDAACELARVMGAKLLLLHVVQPPPLMVTEIYALGASQTDQMLDAAEDAGAGRLEKLAARCASKGISARTIQRIGLPVVEILGRAKQADYIVMGSHGHGAMYELLVGSTTHGVLLKAACPVMIVPRRRSGRR